MKKFGRIPVYIFGSPNSLELNFCVSAGANSEYSYSGCFYPEKLTLEESMNRLDDMHRRGKLIY